MMEQELYRTGEPGMPEDTEPLHVPARAAAAEDEIARLRGLLAAAAERERALVHEVQHRVRNMLSVIRSVYRRTRESGASQDEFAEHFEGRLNAIARYQSHLDHPGSTGADLEDVLRDELLAAQCGEGPQCTIDGPPVLLSQKAAELMALAIHELTTNSIKFGALSHEGKLDIRWSVEDDGDGRRLRFRWHETGVPLVSAAPRPSGFGRQFIEEALPYQLDAVTSFALKPGGIECTILVPLGAAADVGRAAELPDLSLLVEAEEVR